MRSRWFHAPSLHVHGQGVEKRATWLELFYDLIFVAAFIQLGNGLSTHADAPGMLLFAGVFVPMWVSWTGFTFFENRFTVDDFLHRMLVFGQMGCVGAMALSGAGVLDGRLAPFALATGVSLLLVALMYARTIGQIEEARDYNALWGGVFAVGGVIWIAAAFVPTAIGMALGALATVVVLTAPVTKRSRELNEKYPIDFEHLGERYALLTIIVLGEAFVKLVGGLAAEGSGSTAYLQAGAVLLITCGVWWVYFDDVAGARLRKGRFHWLIWFYAHLPLQMAIVALGVSVKKALAFSWDVSAPDGYRWLLAGTLGMVFASVAAIDSVTERKIAELSDRARVNARILSTVLLVVLAAAGRAMSGGLFLSLVIGLTLAQVVFDMMMAPLEEDAAGAASMVSLHDIAKERQDGTQRTVKRRNLSEAIRKGAPSSLRRDLFFYVIEGSWTRVFALFAVAFVIVNLFFAGLYALEPGSIGGTHQDGFAAAFFFSVQTMSTIGFGGMTPATPYADALVAVEAATSMIGVAIVTGFMVAKATRPTNSALFSEVMVVTTLHGQPTLQFRVGNARGNEVVDARVTVSAVLDELSPEGHHFRRIHDLDLHRTRTPVFMLSWTVSHTLDEKSPLHGLKFGGEDGALMAIIVTLTGHDGTYGQTVYARHTYEPTDVRVGERFVDVLHQLDDGRLMIDYSKFHDTCAEELASEGAGLQPPPPSE